MEKKTILAGYIVAAVVYCVLLSVFVSNLSVVLSMTSVFSCTGAVRLAIMHLKIPQDSPQRIAQTTVESGLLGLQLLLGFAASVWLPWEVRGVLIAEIILFGVWAGVALSLGATARVSLAQEQHQKENVKFWKELADEVKSSRPNDADSHKLTQLEEALRWCDPMSGKAIRPMEEEIAHRVHMLATLSGTDVDCECDAILHLVEQRAALCKQMK